MRGDGTRPVDGPVPAGWVSSHEMATSVKRRYLGLGVGRGVGRVVDRRGRGVTGHAWRWVRSAVRCHEPGYNRAADDGDRGNSENCGGEAEAPASPLRPQVTELVDLAHASLRPEKGTTAKLAIRDSDFGGPANSGSPVALRPPLARGLPFRFVRKTFTGLPAQVNESGPITRISTPWQPNDHQKGCRLVAMGFSLPPVLPAPVRRGMGSRTFGGGRRWRTDGWEHARPEYAEDGWREKNCFGQRRNQIADRKACESIDVRTHGCDTDFEAGADSRPKRGLLHTTSYAGDRHIMGLEGLRVRRQTDDDQRRRRLYVVGPEDLGCSGKNKEEDGRDDREKSADPHRLAHLVTQGCFISGGQGEENSGELGGDDVDEADDENAAVNAAFARAR